LPYLFATPYPACIAVISDPAETAAAEAETAVRYFSRIINFIKNISPL